MPRPSINYKLTDDSLIVDNKVYQLASVQVSQMMGPEITLQVVEFDVVEQITILLDADVNPGQFVADIYNKK